jgi:ankyrin repeat protein
MNKRQQATAARFKSKSGQTLLHAAARGKQLAIIQALVAAGHDIYAKDIAGSLPIVYAMTAFTNLNMIMIRKAH